MKLRYKVLAIGTMLCLGGKANAALIEYRFEATINRASGSLPILGNGIEIGDKVSTRFIVKEVPPTTETANYAYFTNTVIAVEVTSNGMNWTTGTGAPNEIPVWDNELAGGGLLFDSFWILAPVAGPALSGLPAWYIGFALFEYGASPSAIVSESLPTSLTLSDFGGFNGGAFAFGNESAAGVLDLSVDFVSARYLVSEPSSSALLAPRPYGPRPELPTEAGSIDALSETRRAPEHEASEVKQASAIALSALLFPVGIVLAQTIKGRTTESIPEIGVETTTTAGSPLYTRVTSDTITSMGGSHAVVGAAVSAPIAEGVVTLARGETLSAQNFGGQAAFVSLSPSYAPASGAGTSEAYFLDLDGDGTFDEVHVGVNKGLFGRSWINATLPTPVPYSVVTANDVAVVLGERFRKELLYLSYSKGTVRLQYREYFEHRARDAFYQDLAYDIESFPARVTFQTMTIEFLGADNSGVRYRIISDLTE